MRKEDVINQFSNFKVTNTGVESSISDNFDSVLRLRDKPDCEYGIGAKVVKANYIAGDAVKEGTKGVITGNINISGEEFYLVNFEGLEFENFTQKYKIKLI